MESLAADCVYHLKILQNIHLKTDLLWKFYYLKTSFFSLHAFEMPLNKLKREFVFDVLSISDNY